MNGGGTEKSPMNFDGREDAGVMECRQDPREPAEAGKTREI